MAAKHYYELDEDVLAAITRFFDRTPKGKTFGNGRVARQLFESMVANQASRLANSSSDIGLNRLAKTDVPRAEGDDGTDRADDGVPPAPSARKLAALVGQQPVRDALLARLRGLVTLHRRRQSIAGLANLVFDGPSGSGRQAVAALLARSLAELGLLSNGVLVPLRLSDVPARWPDQAETVCAHAVVETAGGVLLLDVDERFSARPEPEQGRVIAAVRQVLAEHADTVTVVCGQQPALGALLGGQTELAGRFAEHLRFTDYTPTELADLMLHRWVALGLAVADSVPAVVADRLAMAPPPDGVRGAHRLAGRVAEAVRSPTVRVADLDAAFPESSTITSTVDAQLVEAPERALSLANAR
jgi:hypothetical protein